MINTYGVKIKQTKVVDTENDSFSFPGAPSYHVNEEAA
jgi:hypothetical protein